MQSTYPVEGYRTLSARDYARGFQSAANLNRAESALEKMNRYGFTRFPKSGAGSTARIFLGLPKYVGRIHPAFRVGDLLIEAYKYMNSSKVSSYAGEGYVTGYSYHHDCDNPQHFPRKGFKGGPIGCVTWPPGTPRPKNIYSDPVDEGSPQYWHAVHWAAVGLMHSTRVFRANGLPKAPFALFRSWQYVPAPAARPWVMDDPMAQPLAIPGSTWAPTPKPAPYAKAMMAYRLRVAPRVRSTTEVRLEGQPRLVTARAQRSSAARDAWIVSIRPGVARAGAVGIHWDKPPEYKWTKERKARLKAGSAFHVMKRLFNATTEGFDAVDAIYYALPEGLRSDLFVEYGYYMNPADKAQAMWKHSESIDIQKAVINLFVNEIVDQLAGRMQKAKAKGFKKIGIGPTGSTPAHVLRLARKRAQDVVSDLPMDDGQFVEAR